MGNLTDITEELCDRNALVCSKCSRIFEQGENNFSQVGMLTPCPNCDGQLVWITRSDGIDILYLAIQYNNQNEE